ncbi:MAG: FAD binding domain-containing protein [Gammaproteobacteria bacterium]
MKPRAFDYVKAESVRHATDLLAQHGSNACLLAGGQSLVANLNLRRCSPATLIDIAELAELQSIRIDDGTLILGGGVRHTELEHNDLVRRHAPLLAVAVKHLGNIAVRNRGTVGGNVAYADPASELPACCMALDGEFELCGAKGTRRISARSFIHAPFATARQADEVITAIRVPIDTEATKTVFRECARRFGGFALMGMAMHATWSGDRLASLSPAFFGLGRAPQLAERAASMLVGAEPSDALIDDAANKLTDEIDPASDMHASATYRKHLARHLFVQGLKAMRDGE